MGAEQPLGTIVDGHAPGEAPSPSPSITRRRTPAALAVGVRPFQGTAAPFATGPLPAAVVDLGQAKNEFNNRHLPASGLAQFGMRI